MNAKERFYSGLAKETIGKITSNTDNWTSFLRTMSRNYEFTYPEQVMIYAQRPNATFCKPYEDWNAENYRRYVKRGSTGIALFVMNRDKPYLRYVFDVADTGVRRSSPELKPWEVTPENRSYVMEAMERTFGVAADGVLEAQLEDIASALAAEYWDDYKKQFLDIVANSFLEEYDELNIEVAFKNAVANSVSYTMYCRFVESPDNYFEHEDFQKVFDFNTRQTVNALGTAVNAISTRMFQEIEKAIGEHEQIKATERSTDYERDDLQTGRRLSDSEPSVGERGRETSGQVRQDASSIFGTEQSDAPERHDSDGEPVPAPVGDRGNSESQSGVSDGAVPEGQPRTGQGNAADGVGAAHEQPESTGGGSRDDGAYQQLSLNLFLSENEQISFIDRAESFTPSAFSFAQEEIDHFLLLGSNTDEARKVVALEYMKQKPLEEIVQTLKQVYHGGYGLKEDSGNICAWYAEDGIHLGSTQKMGAGTNVQDKLVAVHHLDVGWRPSDMTQRNGRIIRQGNRNKEVQVYQYVTEGTFDAYLYQTLENKQKFISQIMTSKSPVRSCDDVDEQALSYAEIKALCAGNPLIKEKMDLDIDVARLKVLKADHQSQQYRMEDKLLKYFPAEIEKQTGYIHGFEADIKTVEAHPQIADGFCGMEIMGKAYTEKADAGEILLAACKDTKSADPVPLGSYRGFQMELSFDSFRNEFDVTLKGAVSHRVALGTDARGNITRLDNALAGILERLERANEQLNNLYNQQEAAKAEVGKPFPQEAELTAKSQRLAELDAALNMEDSVENRDERSESERPSVLADLKSKAEHIPPAKYSETREEVL